MAKRTPRKKVGPKKKLGQAFASQDSLDDTARMIHAPIVHWSLGTR
ncbi:MAG: hypothetical protein IID42_11310 [Planctomycetes bacterium]|nr:hypothetical protein [Planctomycetota bacterium]